MDDAEHSAFSLRPSPRLIDADAMDGCEQAIVDRAEGRKRAGDEYRLAGVLVTPWRLRMEAQHVAVVGRAVEAASVQIILDRRPMRLAALIPKLDRARDPVEIVRGAGPLLSFIIK